METAYTPGGAEMVGVGGTGVGGRRVGVRMGPSAVGLSVGRGVMPDSVPGTNAWLVGAGVEPAVEAGSTVIETSAGSLAAPDALNARTLKVCVPGAAFQV